MAQLTSKQLKMATEATEAINLANEGKARCRYCKQVCPLDDVLATFYRGNLLFCACATCFQQYPVVMKRTERDGKPCIYVGPLREQDRPSDILLASSVPADLVHRAAPKLQKKEF